MIRRVICLFLMFAFLAPVLQPAPANASTAQCCLYITKHLSQQPLTLRVSPTTPRPGDVIIARVSFPDAVKVVGNFGARLLRFRPETPLTDTHAYTQAYTQAISRSFVALIGLDALFPAGVYSLTVMATDEQGGYTQSTQSIKVLRRAGIIESVKLSKTLSPTLDPAANEDEALQFTQMYSGYTERKLWNGVFQWPIKGRLSALYGNHRVYNGIDLGTYHSGYDIVARTGTPVKAAAPGQVVAVKRFLVHGLTVVLDHGDGVFSAYSHLSKALVTAGQMVTTTNQAIALVGTTGRSQGPHLHFEIAVSGVPIDPGPWLKSPLP